MVQTLNDIIQKVQENDPTLTKVCTKPFGTISAIDMTRLAEGLINNTHVTHLDFESSSLSDETVSILAGALNINTSVTHLNLSYNNIGPVGAKVLAEMFKINERIWLLNLRNNYLTDEGISCLSQSLQVNRGVCWINLLDNQITDKGVAPLAEMIRVNPRIACIDLMSPNDSSVLLGADISNKITITGQHMLENAAGQSANKNIFYCTPAGEAFARYCQDNGNAIGTLIGRIKAGNIPRAAFPEIQSRIFGIIALADTLPRMALAPHMLAEMYAQAKKAGIKMDVAQSSEVVPELDQLRSLADLRHPIRESNPKSILFEMVRTGRFSEVVQIGRMAGERLTAEDYLSRMHDTATSVIDLLTMQRQLHQVFTWENWIGRPREMQQVAARVPIAELKGQLDGKDGRPNYDQVLSTLNAGVVKSFRR